MAAQADPMMAVSGKELSVKSFFEQWDQTSGTASKWNWTHMKDTVLKEKPVGERWLIVKSEDTMPSKDYSAPFVPNFIIIVDRLENLKAKRQTPRYLMRSMDATEDMDPEAYRAEEVVEMVGNFEWRPLEGYKDVFVLCKLSPDAKSGTGAKEPEQDKEGASKKRRREDEEEKEEDESSSKKRCTESETAPTNSSSTFSFGSGGGGFGSTTKSSSTTAFSFGSTTRASTSSGFSFDASAFSFRTTASSSASGGFGGGFDASAFATFGAPQETVEFVYPILWEKGDTDSNDEDDEDDEDEEEKEEMKGTIGDLKRAIKGGMKIIMRYSLGNSKTAKVVVENDRKFQRLGEDEQQLVVMRSLEKVALAASASYRKLQEEADKADYIAGEQEERQKKFQASRDAILKEEPTKSLLAKLKSDHMEAMYKKVRGIAIARNEAVDKKLALLDQLHEELTAGKIMCRDDVSVRRIFPETDSLGQVGAFMTCSRLNKAMGRAADFVYPAEERLINGLTGKPM